MEEKANHLDNQQSCFAYKVLSNNPVRYRAGVDFEGFLPKNLAAKINPTKFDLRSLGLSAHDIVWVTIMSYISFMGGKIIGIGEYLYQLFASILTFVISCTLKTMETPSRFAYKQYLVNGPSVAWALTKAYVFNERPQNMLEISSTIPPLMLVPSSICLVLTVKRHEFPFPPEIPLSNASEEEVQYRMEERMNFVMNTHKHYSMQKAVLLTNVAKFVCWSAMVGKISELQVYERLGVLWKTDISNLVSLISSELRHLERRSHKEDRSYFPRVVLKSGQIEYEIEDSEEEGESNIESIINSYGSKRVFVVHLLSESTRLSSAPDMIIVPDSQATSLFQVEGLKNEQYSGFESIFMFYSTKKFSYKSYLQSLYSYAIDMKTHK